MDILIGGQVASGSLFYCHFSRAMFLIFSSHQGFYQPRYLPTSRGFLSYYGFLSGCEDHVDQLNCCGPCNQTKYGIGKVIDLYEADVEKNFSRPAIGRNGSNNMFGFTSHAVATIHAHAAENARRRQEQKAEEPERPLFLYASLHNTHAPFQVPGRFENQYNHSFKPQNVWSGMVSAVDETVKNITNALKQASLWENT